MACSNKSGTSSPVGRPMLSVTLPEGYSLAPAEGTDLTRCVYETIERWRGQPDQLNLLTLEASSLITAVSTRTAATQKQGWLSRAYNRITGTNARISIQNQADLARCLYVAQETLNHLYAQDLMSFQALTVVEHNVSRLAREVADAQHRIDDVLQALSQFLAKAEKRFEKLERTVALLEWKSHLKTDKPAWGNRSYSEIGLFPKLVCLANDFITISHAQWVPNDLYTLQAALQELDIDHKEQVQPTDLIRACNGEFIDGLLQRWLDGVASPDDLDEYASSDMPLALSFAQLRRSRTEDSHYLDTLSSMALGVDRTELEMKVATAYVQKHTGCDLSRAQPIFEVVKVLVGELFRLKTFVSVRDQEDFEVSSIEDQRTADTSISTSRPTDDIKTFEFEVVTVDRQGCIAERRRASARYFTEILRGDLPLEMVAIPGGTFTMGSPPTEANRDPYEGPQHTVTVATFFMGRYPITQAQWRAVAGLPQLERRLDHEPHFTGDALPMESISWHDAVEFCARLARVTGRPYRLPSEAEWEYACRAGTTSPFHYGETITPDLVNYDGNYPYPHRDFSDFLAHPPWGAMWLAKGLALAGFVGSKGLYRGTTTPVGSVGYPNFFGLYDMHGNVSEWCQDTPHNDYAGAPTNGHSWEAGSPYPTHRKSRGGSWRIAAQHCRAARRPAPEADSRDNDRGLRVVFSAARTPA